ncbi:MAG: DUF4833 domain-containing protein [Bacteroidales bacterium]|nr:DUF4833 domain-containing protein [Bacteroidales bacterium]
MKYLLLLLSVISFLNVFAQPGNYPVPPETQSRLFYIQRNHNENTVIYDANFDKNGNLIENDPVDVYWIRYQEHGQRMELRAIEKRFAFGEKCERLKSNPDFFILKIAATDKKQLLLKQTKKFKAEVYVKINEKISFLDHLYIFADNSGIWPEVKYIELFGKDINTGEKTYEKMINP